jgi:hypothetical protein
MEKDKNRKLTKKVCHPKKKKKINKIMKTISFLCLLSLIFACCASVMMSSVNATSLFHSAQQNQKQKSVVAPNPNKKARMYVSYCPTYFTNAIAVIDVNVYTGVYNIVGTSHLPSGVFGCSADYNPTFALDEKTDVVWMDFTSDLGYFVKVEVSDYNNATGTGKVTTSAFSSSSDFFTGFLNFKVRDSQGEFEGMTGTVTQDGFCSDGCIGWSGMSLVTRKAPVVALPFKEIADDTSYVDRVNNIFYVQAAYDLRDVTCAPQPWQDCLLSIDTLNGTLLRSVYNHDEHVYRFGYPSQPTSSGSRRHRTEAAATGSLIVDAFVVGMNQRCNKSANETNYAFARVNFEIISCAPTNVVIHEGPWISSFSRDNSVFSTASGNDDGDSAQFLTYDVTTGSVALQTKLTGLGKKLDAKMGLIFIWALWVE